jgi:hypothetical protein
LIVLSGEASLSELSAIDHRIRLRRLFGLSRKGERKMKGNLTGLRLSIVVLFLGGALACGIGSSAPTGAPPEVAADTPVSPEAADTPAPKPTDASQPTDAPPPATTAEVKEAVFAHGLTDEMQPLDPGSDFAPDETVYLSVTIQGRPKEGNITARFYWHDDLIAEADVDLADANSGLIFSFGEDTYVGYTLTHDDPFPISGAYRADVFHDDEFLDSYAFRVVPPPGALPSEVREVTLARGADADYNPVDRTTTFAPDDEVYIVGRGDFGLSTWLQVDWYVEGQLDETGTRSITMAEDASDTGFFFSFAPEDGWPVGEHQVALTMNDEEVGRYDFTVEEVPAVSLVPFEDPAGVFSLNYPADYDQIEEDRTEGYNYTFLASDGSGAINVFFASLGEPFSEDEWELFIEGYTVAGTSGFGEDAVELDRQLGEPGVHALYLEAESEESGVHGMVWVEEVAGVLAVAALVAPIEQWPEQQAALAESLDSFTWSPDEVQSVIQPVPTPTPVPVPPTPTPLPPPTSTLAPPPPTPTPSVWWPGQPDVPPGMACFLVVSKIGGEVTFNLGPQTQRIPPNGHIWFIIEPGHTTWTADMADGRRAGGELDIQPGCEPFVNAMSLSG